MSITTVPSSAVNPIDFVDCPTGMNLNIGSGVHGTIYAGSTTLPQNGTLTFHAGLTGYTPNPGFVGLDHFDYLSPWTGEVWGTVYLTVGPSGTLAPDQYAVGISHVDAHEAGLLIPIGGSVGSGDSRPTISGTGAPGTLITVQDGATTVGTTTANANGHWSLTPTQDLAIGDHALTANGSTAYPVTRDWVHASNENLLMVQDTTQVFTPADLTGDDTGLGGATVSLKSIGTPSHGTITQDASGNHVYTPTAGYTGTDSFTYTVTDQNGHDKVETVHVSVMPPNQSPVITSIEDNYGTLRGPTVLGGGSDDPTPTTLGTGVPGMQVTVYDNGTAAGTTTVGPDGHWSLTPSIDLTAGVQHDFTPIGESLDGSGPTPASNIYYFTQMDPYLPAIIFSVQDNVGPVQGTVNWTQPSDDPTPTFIGSGEPGATITLSDRLTGTVLGSTVIDADSNWQITSVPVTATGLRYLNADITYLAGPDHPGPNLTESFGDYYTYNYEPGNTPPPPPVNPVLAPVITDFADNVGAHQGAFYPGGGTNDPLPTLSGTGEPGTVVTLREGSTDLGSATVGADWRWRITPDTPLAVGTHDIAAIGTRQDGSGSTPSMYTYTFTVSADDNVSAQPAVLAPVIVQFDDNVGASQGAVLPFGITDDTTPTFSGTAQPGTQVHLVDHGKALGIATAGDDWQWSFTPDAALTLGAHSVTATGTYVDGSGAMDAMYTFDFKVRTLDALLDSAGLPAQAATPVATPVAQAAAVDLLHAQAAQVSWQATAAHDLAY